MTLEENIKLRIQIIIEDKAKELAEEMITEYAYRLRKEIAKISVNMATEAYKFMSVENNAHGLTITVKNDFLKNL